MKIGILTFHDSDNFGSVLQAYALCRVLNEAGHICEIINLRKPEVKALYSIFKPLNNKGNVAIDIYNFMYLVPIIKKKYIFEKFRNDFLKISSKKYENYTEFQIENFDYDAFVVGSDQVWNTGIADFDRAYLLEFCNDKKKLAYSASFGPNGPNTPIETDMLSAIKKFDLITVREEIAKEKLLEAGCKVETVLDPVFLLSEKEWYKLPKTETFNKRYMLCYFAGGITPEFERFTAKLAKEKKLTRVILMPEWKNFFRGGKHAYASGPVEFCSLIRDAELVCTNSFHATAFSIIFQKKFIVGTNSCGCDERINTLLLNCNLSDREYTEQRKFSEKVDFSKSEEYISKKSLECKKLLFSELG